MQGKYSDLVHPKRTNPLYPQWRFRIGYSGNPHVDVPRDSRMPIHVVTSLGRLGIEKIGVDVLVHPFSNEATHSPGVGR